MPKIELPIACMQARQTVAQLTSAAVSSGLPVFPAGSNKRPCIGGGRGHRDASTDPAEIERLFAHSGAKLIGMPTGEVSGLDVLDFDYRHGARAFEDANSHRMPETRMHQTRSGGRHYVFLHSAEVRNSASSIAPGVDVRGTGGYCILPPSPGYCVISSADPCPWPDWLLELVIPKPKPVRAAVVAVAATGRSSSIERLEETALNKVSSAPDGQKHFTLLNQALVLGGLLHRSRKTESEILSLLMDALPASVRDRKAAERTAIWGIANGIMRPLNPTPYGREGCPHG